MIILASCSKVTTSPEETVNIKNGFGNRNYRLTSDDEVLKLSWYDKRKQDYFYTNWMNNFTNQTILPEGLTTKTTDSKAAYLEDGKVLGNFMYAKNIANRIVALYEDPRRSGQQMYVILCRF